jgi:carboxypeptidase family protein
MLIGFLGIGGTEVSTMAFGFRSVNTFSPETASWILLTFFLAAGTADGQVVKGTFVGTVQDKSGALVPGVKIKVKNLDTNVGNTVSIDSDGNYIVSFLDPGTYSVTAQMTRFGTTVEPSIKLDVGARVRVDFTLEVGDVTQTVSVRATLQGAETDTSTVATTLTTEKLRQLPLPGRNYQVLAQLMPTAVTPLTTPIPGFMPNSLTAGNYFTVGGARGSYLSYSIDGIDANNVWIQTQSVIPSLDAIEESKVQSHNFPAEFGRGAVQFTSTIRSGTNALHGSVYDYLQNEKLNANNFFDNKAGRKKAAFRDNQFGFTVGGPIDLGKVYDGRNKSFFFFGYEGRRRRAGSTAYGLYPDAAWQTGDFSNLKNQDGSPRLIYDPATTRPDGLGGFIRDPFPGNIIPLDRFHPVAANVIAGPSQPLFRPLVTG